NIRLPSGLVVGDADCISICLWTWVLNHGESLDACKRIVSERNEGTLNSLQAVRFKLAEREEIWETPGLLQRVVP
ncbi:hypothetical protein TNCV_4508631, partial [Trichonephila clavipes]